MVLVTNTSKPTAKPHPILQSTTTNLIPTANPGPRRPKETVIVITLRAGPVREKYSIEYICKLTM